MKERKGERPPGREGRELYSEHPSEDHPPASRSTRLLCGEANELFLLIWGIEVDGPGHFALAVLGGTAHLMSVGPSMVAQGHACLAYSSPSKAVKS